MRRREALVQQKAEIDALGRQIAFKEGEERRLRSLIADYQSKIEAIPGVESEWTRLDRDYATIQESYKTLLTKSQDAKIAANLEENQIGEQFKVLDQPQVSDQATTSNRPQINLVAAVIGFFIGFAIVALKEVMDTSFRTEGRRPQRAVAARAGDGPVRAVEGRRGPRPAAARPLDRLGGRDAGDMRRGLLVPAAVEVLGVTRRAAPLFDAAA